MVSRAVSAARLVAKHGPRAVILAREAKRQGALQKKGELRPFIEFLGKRRPRVVVEIGTYRGGTLWLWCRLARRDGHLISIDLPGGDFGGGYGQDDTQRLRGFVRADQRMTLIQADSHSSETRERLIEALDGAMIDFLFIDGDHTYDGVKQDFEMYAPLVRTGGVIAFHDVLPHPHDARCQVDRLWREIKLGSSGQFEFVEAASSEADRQWGGIGAIVTS